MQTQVLYQPFQGLEISAFPIFPQFRMSIQKVDDRDPHIIYSTNWQQGGSSHEYSGTVMFTSDANATMAYTFSGESITELYDFMKGFAKFLPGASGISVWGTTPNAMPQSGPSPGATYRIDNGTPETTFPNRDLFKNRYQQMFFQSQTLTPDESHTLVVTTLTQDGTFYFDFIQLTLVNSVTSQTTSTLTTIPSGSLFPTLPSISDYSTTPTSTSIPVSAGISITSPAYSSAMNMPSMNNVVSQPSTNPGTIIGCTIGGLGVIAAIVGLATTILKLKYRITRIHKQKDDMERGKKFHHHSFIPIDF